MTDQEKGADTQQCSEEIAYPAIDRALALLRNRLQPPPKCVTDNFADPAGLIESSVTGTDPVHVADNFDATACKPNFVTNIAVKVETPRLTCSTLAALCREAALVQYGWTKRHVLRNTAENAPNMLSEPVLKLLHGFYSSYLVRRHFAFWKELKGLTRRRSIQLNQRAAALCAASKRLLPGSLHVTDFIASRGKLELAMLWDTRRVKRKYLALWLRAAGAVPRNTT
jgi:hypothetical protein